MWTVTSFFGLRKAFSVPDPHLEIRGWGGGDGRGGHPNHEITRGAGIQKKRFFRPFGPQFGLKIRGNGTPPLDPPLDWFTVTRICERWRKFIVYEPITNESSSRAGVRMLRGELAGFSLVYDIWKLLVTRIFWGFSLENLTSQTTQLHVNNCYRSITRPAKATDVRFRIYFEETDACAKPWSRAFDEQVKKP